MASLIRPRIVALDTAQLSGWAEAGPKRARDGAQAHGRPTDGRTQETCALACERR